MSGFVLHPDALNDLNEIWNFIAVDNLAAADRVLQEINDAIRAVLHGRRNPRVIAAFLRARK